MKIVNLIVENILKIRAIHIQPTSPVIEIKGENAAGKSSILDAIVIAFKGKKSAPIEPVKRGAKKGTIRLELDGEPAAGVPPFTITSKVTNDKIETIIEPAELLKGETPRSFLDKLLGHISFDPLEFMNQDSARQRTVLAELVGVDLVAYDQKEKAIYDERTIKGRELKTAQAKVKDLTCYPEIQSTEEVRFVELSTKLSEAMENNQSIERRRLDNERVLEQGKKVKAEIEQLQSRLLELQDGMAKLRKVYQEEKAKLSFLEPTDIDSINTEIQSIEQTNVKIRANRLYNTEQAALEAIQAAYDKLDTKIAGIREDRLQAIQAAKIPVSGLTFSDDGLTYNSIPLSQCSDGEKLMVSMGISMALNPTLRVLRIKDGSLLGPKNLAILKDMVKEEGFQLWIESVAGREEYDKTGQKGIYIEEGEAVEGEGIVKDCKEEAPKLSKKIPKQSPAPQDDEW